MDVAVGCQFAPVSHQPGQEAAQSYISLCTSDQLCLVWPILQINSWITMTTSHANIKARVRLEALLLDCHLPFMRWAGRRLHPPCPLLSRCHCSRCVLYCHGRSGSRDVTDACLTSLLSTGEPGVPGDGRGHDVPPLGRHRYHEVQGTVAPLICQVSIYNASVTNPLSVAPMASDQLRCLVASVSGGGCSFSL